MRFRIRLLLAAAVCVVVTGCGGRVSEHTPATTSHDVVAGIGYWTLLDGDLPGYETWSVKAAVLPQSWANVLPVRGITSQVLARDGFLTGVFQILRKRSDRAFSVAQAFVHPSGARSFLRYETSRLRDQASSPLDPGIPGAVGFVREEPTREAEVTFAEDHTVVLVVVPGPPRNAISAARLLYERRGSAPNARLSGR